MPFSLLQLCLFHSFSQHFEISKRLDRSTSLASRNFKITLASWCKKSQKVNKTHIGCFYSCLRFIIRMIIHSVIGCTNRSSNKENRFYQVPTPETNPVLRQKWLHNIRRDGELPKHKSFYTLLHEINNMWLLARMTLFRVNKNRP